MEQQHEIGAELRAYLQERGCALQEAEARALSVLLIDLIAEDLIAADSPSETATPITLAVSLHQGGDRG